MFDRFLTTLRGLRGPTDGTAESRPSDGTGTGAATPGRADEGAARMFVCASCNRAYIDREMETCSTCGEVVQASRARERRRE